MSHAVHFTRASLFLVLAFLVMSPAWPQTSVDAAYFPVDVPVDSALSDVAPTSGLVSSGYRSIHLSNYMSGLNTPFQVTADNDTFFVSNIGTNTVLMYQITSSGIVYVRTFGSGGSGAGQFNGPEQVAVVGNDVYIADFNNNRIQRFKKSTGAYVSQFGTAGSGPGQLSNPSGLVYNPANRVLKNPPPHARERSF